MNFADSEIQFCSSVQLVTSSCVMNALESSGPTSVIGFFQIKLEANDMCQKSCFSREASASAHAVLNCDTT